VIIQSTLSKANANRDYKIFEEFAYKMISIAQRKRIAKKFEIAGRFYAFDSTTIDSCMNLFWWAKFRKVKGGIKYIPFMMLLPKSLPLFTKFMT
jgi:hypothetical protein